MICRTAMGLAIGVVGLTGCMDRSFLNPDMTIGEALGWEKVKTPEPPKYPAASLQMAERVETLGRRIIAQNTFTGLDPFFHTIGVPESMLFHRGTTALYISEGLVKQCKSDEELAAVLCSELGRMMAEQRVASRVGRDRDQIPNVALPGSGSAFDQTREAELALQKDRQPRSDRVTTPHDPKQLARELMQGAGYDPAELTQIEPLLKQSERGEVLRKQMAGSGAAPKWVR